MTCAFSFLGRVPNVWVMPSHALITLLGVRHHRLELADQAVRTWQRTRENLDTAAVALGRRMDVQAVMEGDAVMCALAQDAAVRQRWELRVLQDKCVAAAQQEAQHRRTQVAAAQDAKVLERVMDKRAALAKVASNRAEQALLEETFLMAHCQPQARVA